MGAEFLAMLLVVVYVGAVAVLFLFVVMMLDVDFASLRQGFARYMPIGLMIAAFLAAEMVLVATTVSTQGAARHNLSPLASGSGSTLSNAEAIGRVLYTDYVYFFQAAGLVLLVAMIGAIVLTLRHKPGVKRQIVMNQVLRTPATGMKLVNPKPGEGIDA
jgi:NADH-quinone oxidoreductase subunit J